MNLAPVAPAVADAGFEVPALGNGYKYDPTGAGWTFTGSSGVSGNGGAFTSKNPNAPQGTQVGFLQGTGSFSQTISGWTAGTYEINFDAAQRNGNHQNFAVLVDGVNVGNFTPGGIQLRLLQHRHVLRDRRYPHHHVRGRWTRRGATTPRSSTPCRSRRSEQYSLKTLASDRFSIQLEIGLTLRQEVHERRIAANVKSLERRERTKRKRTDRARQSSRWPTSGGTNLVPMHLVPPRRKQARGNPFKPRVIVSYSQYAGTVWLLFGNFGETLTPASRPGATAARGMHGHECQLTLNVPVVPISRNVPFEKFVSRSMLRS